VKADGRLGTAALRRGRVTVQDSAWHADVDAPDFVNPPVAQRIAADIALVLVYADSAPQLVRGRVRSTGLRAANSRFGTRACSTARRGSHAGTDFLVPPDACQGAQRRPCRRRPICSSAAFGHHRSRALPVLVLAPVGHQGRGRAVDCRGRIVGLVGATGRVWSTLHWALRLVEHVWIASLR
jgi:hypothetical protein